MSIQLMTAVWKVQGLTQAQKLVLLSLADNSNDAGICWPSVTAIAERCCMAPRSVTRTITELEQLNHISREERSGKATIYRITPDRPSPVTERRSDAASSRPTDSTSPDRPSPPPDAGTGVPDTPNKEITTKEPKAEPASARDDFFQMSFEYIVSKFPNLMTANPSAIHQWKEAGYDFERHVKPVIDSAAAKRSEPRSFKFFTPAITEAATALPKANGNATPGKQSAYEGMSREEIIAQKQRQNDRLQGFQQGKRA